MTEPGQLPAETSDPDDRSAAFPTVAEAADVDREPAAAAVRLRSGRARTAGHAAARTHRGGAGAARLRAALPTTPPPPGEGGTPIADVARLLNVPMPTLRSWEIRYGIPEISREPGKHRRYSVDELHALRLMRDEIARGKRASAAAQSVRSLLGVSGPAAGIVQNVLAASRRGDAQEIRGQLTSAEQSLGLGACIDDVLLPALRQVGLWWAAGHCEIDEERLTTDAVRSWLDRKSAFAPAPSRNNPILLACGPTDLHTVGIEALAVMLRYRGWPCRILGARTSVASLATAAEASGAVAAVIVSHLASARLRAVESMRAVGHLPVTVFYAGNAFASPRSRQRVPGTFLGFRLQAACDLIDRTLAARVG